MNTNIHVNVDEIPPEGRANRLRIPRIPQAFPAKPGTHGRVRGIPSRTPSES